MAYDKIQASPSLPPPPPEATIYEQKLFTAMLVYLNTVSRAVNDVIEGRIEVYRPKVMYAAPTNPQTADVVYADGTTWNPGAGEGLYEYRGSVWHKV